MSREILSVPGTVILLHDPNLLLRQPVKVVHKPVNLLVGGVNLALELVIA